MRLKILTITAWLFFFAFTPKVFAEEAIFDTSNKEPALFPYKKKFVVSSYYTPLPNQSRYITGTFEGDVWLNGEGVHAADGTKVYPGIAAAPKRFPFGTKMHIPGFGTVTIHDRGGAIKGDRLDIWVGSGDEALRRALGWGLRTVEVTVYGLDENIKESVDIESLPKVDEIGILARTRYFKQDLALGDSGEAVRTLQRYLKKFGYFSVEATGYYGEETQSAVRSFQLSQKVLDESNDSGAGNFGPRTRVALEGLMDKKRYEARKNVPQVVLQRGSKGPEVEALQSTLKEYGFLKESSGTFDEATAQALTQFQIDYGIVTSSRDLGAGFYGPKSQVALEQLVTASLTPSSTALISRKRGAPGDSTENDEPPVKVAFTKQLAFGDRGEEVEMLQDELSRLHFIGLAPTGYYGKTTAHAVLKFQQAFDVVRSEKDEGAGSVGPKTLEKLNKFATGRFTQQRKVARATTNYNILSARIKDERQLIAEAVRSGESAFITADLLYGSRGSEVKKLQVLLKHLGFFPGRLTTEYFGDITKRSLLAFQKSHGISESGIFDERTRQIFNKLTPS